MSNLFNFSNKKILVTGASSGIGRATSILLATLGAQVFLVARNQENLEATLNTLEGVKHKIYPFDLTQYNQIPQFIDQMVEENGPLDGLFHSAGCELIRPIKLLKEQNITDIFHSSVYAGLMLAKGFSSKRNTNENGQSLVLMSSVASKVGQVGLSTYSASKGAIDAAVKSLAVELAPKKIRVNSIVAGAIETNMHKRITKNLSEKSLSDYENQHLLGFGRPEDIAQAVCFLLGEQSRWITGTNLIVDGGYTCR